MTMGNYHHGEFVQGRGWYDDSVKGYVDTPASLTKTLYAAPPKPRTLDNYDFDAMSKEDRKQKAALQNWKPNQDMENLRRMRDSDRPEERAIFDAQCTGTKRMSFGAYESGLRGYLDAGGKLPTGVSEPAKQRDRVKVEEVQREWWESA